MQWIGSSEGTSFEQLFLPRRLPFSTPLQCPVGPFVSFDNYPLNQIGPLPFIYQLYSLGLKVFSSFVLSDAVSFPGPDLRLLLSQS
jgi:hypothetical protein